jgi:conjugative transfer signal peptidase TraF
MTVSVEKVVPLRRCRRAAVISMGAAGVVTFAGVIGLGAVGFRVNLTASEPLGLWRVVRADRPVRVGDLVFVCPPVSDVMRVARSRGYLRHGLCIGGFAPLIKTVAAMAGQMVEIDESVRIDGRELAHSHLMDRDGRGRPMQSYPGGILPPGTVYLHSDFPGSFDSRYFGPVPIGSILGLAQEVWTGAL